MGIQSALLDFARAITLGAGAVLAILAIVSLGIPRRMNHNVARPLAQKSR